MQVCRNTKTRDYRTLWMGTISRLGNGLHGALRWLRHLLLMKNIPNRPGTRDYRTLWMGTIGRLGNGLHGALRWLRHLLLMKNIPNRHGTRAYRTPWMGTISVFVCQSAVDMMLCVALPWNSSVRIIKDGNHQPF